MPEFDSTRCCARNFCSCHRWKPVTFPAGCQDFPYRPKSLVVDSFQMETPGPIRVVRTNTDRWVGEFQRERLVGIDYSVEEDLSGITSTAALTQAYLRWKPD